MTTLSDRSHVPLHSRRVGWDRQIGCRRGFRHAADPRPGRRWPRQAQIPAESQGVRRGAPRCERACCASLLWHRGRGGQAERDGAAELARLAGMSRGLAVENRWLPDLERGYDGIVVGAYARHDALRLQGQSPVQDVVEAAPPGRGWLVDGNFRETCPGEQLP